MQRPSDLFVHNRYLAHAVINSGCSYAEAFNFAIEQDIGEGGKIGCESCENCHRPQVIAIGGHICPWVQCDEGFPKKARNSHLVQEHEGK